jgi:hypothetical protein
MDGTRAAKAVDGKKIRRAQKACEGSTPSARTMLSTICAGRNQWKSASATASSTSSFRPRRRFKRSSVSSSIFFMVRAAMQSSIAWYSGVHYRLPIAAFLLSLSLTTISLLAQTSSGTTQAPATDNDITRGELQHFDGFLDSHEAVAKEVKQNPGRINDENYIINHPELAEFLKNHPGVREEIRENHQAFINRENRFEAAGKDISRVELRRFDNYLDQHPEVAQELKSDPKLVDDKDYLAAHPELKDFLGDHPRVREDLKQHPSAFMNRETKFDSGERAAAGERDITRGELEHFDGFLDSRQAIADDLKKNPKLINDENYIINHPELAEFLKAHSEAREEIRENPNAFMDREKRFENAGKDVTRAELRNFDNYLDQHSYIAQDLKKNPKLVDDKKYMAAHPGLQEFLENHPHVREDLKQHPRVYMARERGFEKHEAQHHRR